MTITQAYNKSPGSIRKAEDAEKQRLRHCEEAEQFYRELQKQGVSVRVGMEATGHSRWWHLSRKLCLKGSCGGFEARLEHGIELGQGGAEGAARVAPALRLETLNLRGTDTESAVAQIFLLGLPKLPLMISPQTRKRQKTLLRPAASFVLAEGRIILSRNSFE